MKRNYWLIMLVAVVALGIGYAAVANINLFVSGSATAYGSATDSDFIVRFVKSDDDESEFEAISTAAANPASYVTSSGSSATVTSSITDDTNATFSINGLSEVGEYVTLTYYVTNLSEELPAYVYVDVLNSNNDQSDYFKITKVVQNTQLLTKGSVTPVTVKVEVVKLPKLDLTGNFLVKLVASATKNATVEIGTTTNNVVYTTAGTRNEIEDLLEDENISKVYVTLNDDIDYSSNEIVIGENKDVTIDLNGNSITSAYNGPAILNNGSLTLTGEGSVNNTNTSKQGNDVIINYGTLEINDGTYGSDSTRGAAVRNNGVAVINGGTYRSIDNGKLSGAYAYAIINNDESATLTINDATVVGKMNGCIASNAGTTVINGGYFELLEHNKTTYYVIYDGAGGVTINGGTFKDAKRTSNSYFTSYKEAMDEGKLEGDGHLVINAGTFDRDVTLYVEPTSTMTMVSETEYIVTRN